MTPEQIGRVQQSYRLFKADMPGIIDDFYHHLFEYHPELMSLFPADMDEQMKKMVDTMAYVIESLDQWDMLVENVRELGRRHAQYGVHAIDYDAVGRSLLWALHKHGGAQFDNDDEAAWGCAYQTLADAMSRVH